MLDPRKDHGGVSVGLFLGAAIAFASARSRLLCAFFELPMNIIKATPVASFVILALVWIRSSNLSMFIAFLMVLPLVWSNVREGIRNTDPKLLEMAKVFRLSRAAALKNITIPTVCRIFYQPPKRGSAFPGNRALRGSPCDPVRSNRHAAL
jgi:NitT/TauT family transport system permease protein